MIIKYKNKKYKITILPSVFIVIFLVILTIYIQSQIGSGIIDGHITNIEILLMNLWLFGITTFSLVGLMSVNYFLKYGLFVKEVKK